MQPPTLMIPNFEECPSRGIRKVKQILKVNNPSQVHAPIDDDAGMATKTCGSPRNQLPLQQQRRAWLQAKQRFNASNAASSISNIDKLLESLPSAPTNESSRNMFDHFNWSSGSLQLEVSTRTLQAGNLSSSSLSLPQLTGISTRTLQADNLSSGDLPFPNSSQCSKGQNIDLISLKTQVRSVPQESGERSVSARCHSRKTSVNRHRSKSPKKEKNVGRSDSERSRSTTPQTRRECSSEKDLRLSDNSTGKSRRSKSRKRRDRSKSKSRRRSSKEASEESSPCRTTAASCWADRVGQ